MKKLMLFKTMDGSIRAKMINCYDYDQIDAYMDYDEILTRVRLSEIPTLLKILYGE